MSTPRPGSRSPEADPWWRIRNSLWLVPVIFSCGLFSWVGFGYVALMRRSHRPSWIAAGLSLASCVIIGVLIAVVPTSEESANGASGAASTASGLILVTSWLGFIVLGFVMNQGYLRWRAGADGAGASPQLLHAPPAAPGGAWAPPLGQPLGPSSAPVPLAAPAPLPEPVRGLLDAPDAPPGPPPMPVPATGATHAPAKRPAPPGSFDVNLASSAEIEAATGLQAAAVTTILAARESGGAFASLDDLIVRTGLPPHQAATLMRASFGPTAQSSGPVPQSSSPSPQSPSQQGPPSGATGTGHGRVLDF